MYEKNCYSFYQLIVSIRILTYILLKKSAFFKLKGELRMEYLCEKVEAQYI